MRNLTAANSQWLFGPKTDLLFGCGLAYVPVFLLLLYAGSHIETAIPLAITPLIALFLSTPHYGATLLRVYEKREDRQKYRFFSIYLTIAVWLWFTVAVHDSLAGTLLLTLYLVWSPWHYMGQNYGIALMFLGRKGIEIPPGLKRLIHLSFLSSFFLAMTEMQAFPSTGAYYQVITLELSAELRDILFVIFGCTYLYSTIHAAIRLKKFGSFADLIPSALLVFSQALWFLVPLLAIRFKLYQSTVALSMEHATYAFFWVAIAHAVQYLWITSYYAKKSGSPSLVSAFMSKALLAGALIWVVPALLFSPDIFGNRSYDAGLGLMVAAAVNVHHFILDGAIWKLRHGRLAQILLRDAVPTVVSTAGLSRLRLKPALLGLGLVCAGISYAGTVSSVKAERSIALNDSGGITSAADTLRLLQRDSAKLQRVLAKMAAEDGQLDVAIQHASRAVDLDPSVASDELLDLLYKMAQERKDVGS